MGSSPRARRLAGVGRRAALPVPAPLVPLVVERPAALTGNTQRSKRTVRRK
jgi:hypothetical protein